ncbi:MAG: ribonuclease Z [Selenomonadaceae bacterium]|nr:ribonuclease Z [Selenomonadaceae bacterium]
MIDITLIGTSALMPIPQRALTAVLLTCGGHSILFDCGEGTQTAARKEGISLMRTDIIALTHYHGDHIFGLPGLLQTMTNTEREEPLYIIGPAGLEEAMKPILKLAYFTPYEINLLEIPAEGVRLAELIPGWAYEAKLSAFKTEHRVSSQGYVFTLSRAGKFQPEKAKALGVPINQWGVLQKGQCVEVDGKIILPEQVLGEPRKGLKFVFTGDTAMCETLTEAAEGADLLISEATYGVLEQAPHAVEHGRHMIFSQAAEVAKAAGVKELWLTHYSQMIVDPQEYLPNATAIFPNTICGRDGMSTTLKFEE